MSDGARVTRNFTLTGTWTPTLTFATPGDLSVAYSTRVGSYTKIGSVVLVYFYITTSTFTHTTASSWLQVTGLPFTAGANRGYCATIIQGYTKANFTQVTAYVSGATTLFQFSCGGSGQSATDLAVADMPSAGTVLIIARGSYEV